jgi:hypothetical protein
MLSQDRSDHPYCYARVFGIYHAMVQLNSPRSRRRELHRIEFLWVRWYDVDHSFSAGFAAKRAYQVSFRPGPDTFGFVDPSNILRAAHLIPNFERGTTEELLSPSVARRQDEMDRDYKSYYVNM